MNTDLTAEKIVARLVELVPPGKLRDSKLPFRLQKAERPDDNYSFGIRKGEIFKLGKEFSEMPVDEIEKLMDSPIHDLRVAALSIMGQSAKMHRRTVRGTLSALHSSSRPH